MLLCDHLRKKCDQYLIRLLKSFPRLFIAGFTSRKKNSSAYGVHGLQFTSALSWGALLGRVALLSCQPASCCKQGDDCMPAVLEYL